MHWLLQITASDCRSAYALRRCGLALTEILHTLRGVVGCTHFDTDQSTWKQHVTTQHLTTLWHNYRKMQHKRCETFWVRHVLCTLLRRLYEGCPFGLAGTSPVSNKPPRTRLTMEHNELMQDITRSIDIPCEWRAVRRFVATYPVWELKQLNEIRAHHVTNWSLHRFVPVGESMTVVRCIVRFLAEWHTQHGQQHSTAMGTEDDDDERSKQALYHPGFPCGLPVHVAVFWAFYFRKPCVEFVARIHNHLTKRHLKEGVHRNQMIEAIKTFVHDFCAENGLRGRDWNTDVLPRITAHTLNTWLTKQATLRVTGGARLPTVVIRNIVAMNHFAAMLFPEDVGAILSRAELSLGQSNLNNKEGALSQTMGGVVRTYSQAEISALFGACRCRRDRLMLLLLTRVGLRSTALRTLQVSQVTGGAEGVALEKGKRWHHFFIDPEMQACIEAYVAYEHPNRDLLYLFPHVTQHTRAMTQSQLRTWLQRLAKEARISGSHITIHSFRRYVVTTLLESKNSMEYVARYIGHMSANTTLRYWVTRPTHLVKQMHLPWVDDQNRPTDRSSSVEVPQKLLQQVRELLSDV